MSKKLVIGAGHHYYTAGKRTPDGIHEWTLNDCVVLNVIANLKDYDVEIIREDDSTGQKDVSLDTRNVIVINAMPDLYLSVHHNAYKGEWGNWTGFEVYWMQHNEALGKRCIPYLEKELSKPVNGKVIAQHGGDALRTISLDVLRDIPSTIPALLLEGGYMDSKNDSYYIRTDEGQKNYARAISDFVIAELKLQKKPKKTWLQTCGEAAIKNLDIITYSKGKDMLGSPEKWIEIINDPKLANETIKDTSDLIALMFIMLDRITQR